MNLKSLGSLLRSVGSIPAQIPCSPSSKRLFSRQACLMWQLEQAMTMCRGMQALPLWSGKKSRMGMFLQFALVQSVMVVPLC